MLVSACVLPHPPVLAPEVSVQSPGWLEGLRKTCLDAVARTLAEAVERVVIVGSATAPGRWDETSAGSMAAYGVDVRFGQPGGEPLLPLSLTIAAWLLDEAGWRGSREYVAVDGSTSAAAAADAGRRLVEAQSTAMLVMGDGSARRSMQAPGYLDERAAGFDAAAARALAAADAAAITALDPHLAEELWVAGLPAWQVLAGALDGRFESQVAYDDAPTGVGYLVVSLTRV